MLAIPGSAGVCLALKMKSVHRWLWLGLLLGLSPQAFCQTESVAVAGFQADEIPVVRVTHYWSANGVKPGGRITLALVLDIRKPYHINFDRAAEPYIPTVIELATAPPEVQSSTPVYPEPKSLEFGVGTQKEVIRVFSDRTTVYIPMAVTSTAKPGTLPLEVSVRYQACDDKTCQRPASTETKLTLTVLDPATPETQANAEIFAGLKEAQDRLNIAFFGWDFKIAPSRFWLLLAIAAIGGILLNFTPCVLPLIPIKIIGLSRAAGNRQRCLLLGLSLSAGVIAFWLGLAVAVSSISGFDATNKLFQYPAFTIGVGVIICAMAVGMCGLFAIQLPQAVYRVNPSQESVGGSFLFGIMTAVLSTPCTAPFMGAAAAWSATQRPLITMTTFAAIGTGMALPYLLLSAFPFLVNRMPRTGPASELIKQVMGLFMLAAGAYFLGTGAAGLLAKPPDPPTNAYWWAVAALIAAGGGWLTWRTFQLTKRAINRAVFGLVGLLFVLLAVGMAVRFTRGSPIHWVYYTPERLAERQSQRKIVVLEFTAAWCLNCHALEQTVLHDPRVVKVLNSDSVAPIKIDLTGNNQEGNRKLIDVGRRTIPYLVVYSPDGKPLFASDAYTVDQLLKAIEEAQSSRESR